MFVLSSFKGYKSQHTHTHTNKPIEIKIKLSVMQIRRDWSGPGNNNSRLKKTTGMQIKSIESNRGTTSKLVQRYNMEDCTEVQHGRLYRGSTWKIVQRYNMEDCTEVQHGRLYRGSTWKIVQRFNMEDCTEVQHRSLYRGTTWKIVQRYNMEIYLLPHDTDLDPGVASNTRSMRETEASRFT